MKTHISVKKISFRRTPEDKIYMYSCPSVCKPTCIIFGLKGIISILICRGKDSYHTASYTKITLVTLYSTLTIKLYGRSREQCALKLCNNIQEWASIGACLGIYRNEERATHSKESFIIF